MNRSKDEFPPWCKDSTPTNKKRNKKQVNKYQYIRDGAKTGFFYNRVPKAGSTTTSGLVWRIADHLHIQFPSKPKCANYHTHYAEKGALIRAFGKRKRSHSFLLASVRDPAARALSRVFYHAVSRKKQDPTDELILGHLHDPDRQNGAISAGKGGFHMEYLTFTPIAKNSAWHKETPNTVINPAAIHKNVRRILEDYDFIISVERYDESIVAMQLLLGLEATDILYLPSKISGDKTYTTTEGDKECVVLQKSFVSDPVASHLASDEWYAKQYGDYVLMEAVKQSLDLTIETTIGKDRFQGALDTFLKLKARATEECLATAQFPCSAEGVLQIKEAEESCYQGDCGCGYKCLDRLTNITV
eukprot:scaffold24745_cov117-Cylindrotheca_fusiformis.AAC.2